MRATGDREIDRLGDVIIGAEPERFDDVGAGGARGHHDHGQLRLLMLLAQLGQHVEPAHPRHFDVEEHEVERAIARSRQALRRRSRPC